MLFALLPGHAVCKGAVKRFPSHQYCTVLAAFSVTEPLKLLTSGRRQKSVKKGGTDMPEFLN
jgi:hypothetical protein